MLASAEGDVGADGGAGAEKCGWRYMWVKCNARQVMMWHLLNLTFLEAVFP